MPANDPDCPTGGIQVETGIDENGNGFLDDEEVDKTEKVCNGSIGPPGADGAGGADGMDGSNAVVRLSNEPIGTNCPFSGVRIDAGIDTNGNDILDFGEITEANYICNPGQAVLIEVKEKLIAPDGEAPDLFGRSVSISGDSAIVGAPFTGSIGTDFPGGAYIYQRIGPTS